MTVEELLAMLQEKGMDEEAMEMLLAEAIKAIHPEEEPHEEAPAEDEEANKAKASQLLGVNL